MNPQNDYQITAYLNKINSINDEIKRRNAYIKTLREKKRKTEELMYKYMQKYNMTEYEVQVEKVTPKTKKVTKRTKKIVLENIAPKEAKERKVRKSKKEKRGETIKYLTDLGINDPVDAYNNLSKI